MKRILAGLAIASMLVAGCTSAPESQVTVGESSAAPVIIETPETIVTTEATKESGPRTRTAADGDYLVGTDITPGVWQCRDASNSIYWKTTDRAGEIIDNDLGSIARIPDSAFAVKLTGCVTDWIAVDTAPTTPLGVAAPVATSGTGSSTRDADIANCRAVFVTLSDDSRSQLDSAVVSGRINPVTLFAAVLAHRSSMAFQAQGTARIFDAVSRFDAAALAISRDGLGMSDAETQEFMQSYYEMQTDCASIRAWR